MAKKKRNRRRNNNNNNNTITSAAVEPIEESLDEQGADAIEEPLEEPLDELGADAIEEPFEEPPEESFEEPPEEPLEESLDEQGTDAIEEQPEELFEEPPEEPLEEPLNESVESEKPVRKKWTGFRKFIVISLILEAIIIIAIGVYEYNLIYHSAQVEAGIQVGVEDFLKRPDANAYFTADSEQYDTSVPGTYRLKIMTGGLPHSATLVVKDTIAPEVTVRNLVVNLNEPVEAEEFVEEVKDASLVTVKYVDEPDFALIGDQEIKLMATDLGNNSVQLKAIMSIAPVCKELCLEVGSPLPEAADFVLSEDEAVLDTDIEAVDMNKLGSTDVVLSIKGEKYNSKLTVVDTAAPDFFVDKIEGYTNAHYEAEDYVLRVIDKTAVKFSYETVPDYTLIGTQDVTIIATDEGGNTSVKTTTLTLSEDTEDPVIEGAKDLEAYVGDTVAYKAGITVLDNCDKDLRLEVDTSKVNLNVAGTYPLVYTAYDASGRTASVTVNIQVKEHAYDTDTVNALVEEALQKCTNPSMSKREICESIYNYLHNTIAYISDSEKGDPYRSAYEGLMLKKGDCYVFFSIAKLMLTQAGIANFDIERIPEGTKLHYWNVVDIEDGHGWYHFDTTPRKGRPYLCLLDDAAISAYSVSHDNCHNYDRSKYPVIP